MNRPSTVESQFWTARVDNPRLPLWVRVAAYAERHGDPATGHCPLTPGQLHQGLDPSLSKGSVSRAITKAVKVGWLDPASSARCLVLAGYRPNHPACPATHRTR